MTQITSSDESVDFYDMQNTTLKKPLLAAMISESDQVASPDITSSNHKESRLLQKENKNNSDS